MNKGVLVCLQCSANDGHQPRMRARQMALHGGLCLQGVAVGNGLVDFLMLMHSNLPG